MIALSLPLQWSIWIAVFVVSAILSYIYKGLETGIYVMNKIRLDLLSESGSKPARRIRNVIGNQANFLSVLLLGGNTVDYTATFAIGAMFLLAGCGERSEWYTTAIGPVLFIFFESLPKNVARLAPEPMVYRFSRVLQFSSWFFNATGLAPLVRGFSHLMLGVLRIPNRSYVPMGHEGLAAVVAESQASGVLTHLQTVMAERVMKIADVCLRNVMIPMTKVIYAPTNATTETMRELMRAHSYSRFPTMDSYGKVVAILNIYDALAEADQSGPSGKNTRPLYLPAAMTITDALYHMQREHAPMAIVVDDPGNHVGIVTTKDLVEEIVGELDVW